MGDVDWSKRSYPGYGGANAFTSMGDVDWGKRGVGAARSFAVDDDNDLNKVKRARGLYRSWLSRGNSPGIRQSRYHLVVFLVSSDVSSFSSYSISFIVLFPISKYFYRGFLSRFCVPNRRCQFSILCAQFCACPCRKYN